MFEGPEARRTTARSMPSRRSAHFKPCWMPSRRYKRRADYRRAILTRFAVAAWSGVHGLAKLAIGGQLPFNAKQTFEFAGLT